MLEVESAVQLGLVIEFMCLNREVDNLLPGRDGQEACATLVDVLRWRARASPERAAYGFSARGEGAPSWVSYGALHERCARWASALRARQGPGARALLLCAPGLDYVTAFLSCLTAGVVPVPAYPPPRREWQRPMQRLGALAEDAGAAFVLVTPDVAARSEARASAPAALRRLSWISTEELDAFASDRAGIRAPTPDDVAFVQYTSGTTDDPKGVVVTHAALWHNLAAIRECFQVGPDDRSVIWLPPYHDMGLVGGLLEALFAGFPALLLPPLRFVQQPASWLRAITQVRATVSGGPNFAYDLCVRRIPAEQRAGLELSSWRVAFNGAEPVQAETLGRFRAAFAAHGFRAEAFHPCYGLAEATLLVAGARGVRQERFDAHALDGGRAVPTAHGTGRTLVACGRPFGGDQLFIVDPIRRAPCDSDRVGELWVRGPSVTSGYWNRGADGLLADELAGEGAGPFLRTGDLGFLHGGELFVTGRLKDLIVVRGRNHYPQDIERTVQRSHGWLRADDGAAFAVDGESGEALVVVQAVERPHLARLPAPDVTQAIVEAVAREHGVQVAHLVLVRPGAIPRTTSGKVARGACRRLFLERAFDARSTAEGAAHA
jgi:acyl-CoA synthetase (AMP-forming)/AMP-acid ligase II